MVHKTIQEFLDHLERAGKKSTARGYLTSLAQFWEWLQSQGGDPMSATAETLRAFQRFLAEEYRAANGAGLAKSTQVTRMSAIKAYYGWLVRRGLILADISRAIKLPRLHRRMVHKDYLSLQEVTAMLQTQARRCHKYKEGSYPWARECRDLVLLALAVASGRRRQGLQNLKVTDVNLSRNELRCEWEKGKPGRVLPVVPWAMAVVKVYLEKARPVLAWQEQNEYLIVGERSARLGNGTVGLIMGRVHKETVAQNKDLRELAGKKISLHSLRVSFATLLFSGGCDIRSINELMLHENLTTTARYTPIPLEDLRRACRLAHPRA